MIKLPTSATSYLSVRKAGKVWAVVLVTPGGPVTRLSSVGVKASAIEHGKATAARMQRPFKYLEGSA